MCQYFQSSSDRTLVKEDRYPVLVQRHSDNDVLDPVGQELLKSLNEVVQPDDSHTLKTLLRLLRIVILWLSKQPCQVRRREDSEARRRTGSQLCRNSPPDLPGRNHIKDDFCSQVRFDLPNASLPQILEPLGYHCKYGILCVSRQSGHGRENEEDNSSECHQRVSKTGLPQIRVEPPSDRA